MRNCRFHTIIHTRTTLFLAPNLKEDPLHSLGRRCHVTRLAKGGYVARPDVVDRVGGNDKCSEPGGLYPSVSLYQPAVPSTMQSHCRSGLLSYALLTCLAGWAMHSPEALQAFRTQVRTLTGCLGALHTPSMRGRPGGRAPTATFPPYWVALPTHSRWYSSPARKRGSSTLALPLRGRGRGLRLREGTEGQKCPHVPPCVVHPFALRSPSYERMKKCAVPTPPWPPLPLPRPHSDTLAPSLMGEADV